MGSPARSSHLADVLKWQGTERVRARTVLVAALGMTVPVLVGLALGRAETGFTIGLGAMLLAGETPAGDGAAQERPSPGSALLPAALAVSAATLIASNPAGDNGWADAAMIALAAVAAAISGYSRPVAVAAIRFIVYLVLSFTLIEGAGAHRGWAALVFGLGALWNLAVRMLLAGKREPVEAPATAARQPTPAQRRAYWRRTMATLAGWQYPIRVVIGLGLASLLRHLYPAHHFAWIVLTVALLTQRPLEHLPVKITQRAVGTALGVGLTWLILTEAPRAGAYAALAIGVLICVLATVAAVARARNYLAYAVAATPVILLVVDFSRKVETPLLVDRLLATLIGAAIVVALNLALDLASRGTAKTA